MRAAPVVATERERRTTGETENARYSESENGRIERNVLAFDALAFDVVDI